MQWFPPSMSSIFRDLMSSNAAQQPAAIRAAEASTQAVVETPATMAAPAPLEESAADSADLTKLLETVRGPAPNSYESSRTISAILERVALSLDTLSPAHTTVLVSALGQLEKRDAIVDIVLEAVRVHTHCAGAHVPKRRPCQRLPGAPITCPPYGRSLTATCGTSQWWQRCTCRQKCACLSLLIMPCPGERNGPAQGQGVQRAAAGLHLRQLRGPGPARLRALRAAGRVRRAGAAQLQGAPHEGLLRCCYFHREA